MGGGGSGVTAQFNLRICSCPVFTTHLPFIIGFIWISSQDSCFFIKLIKSILRMVSWSVGGGAALACQHFEHRWGPNPPATYPSNLSNGCAQWLVDEWVDLAAKPTSMLAYLLTCRSNVNACLLTCRSNVNACLLTCRSNVNACLLTYLLTCLLTYLQIQVINAFRSGVEDPDSYEQRSMTSSFHGSKASLNNIRLRRRDSYPPKFKDEQVD